MLGELPEARYSLGRAVELETTGPPAHRFAGTAGFLAECLRHQGQIDQAREQALAAIDAVERSDHMYRDTLRACCLCALGRIALDQSDREAAAVAFRQALLQLRGRPQALGSGHLVALDEALQSFDERRAFDFHAFYGCTDPETIRALAEAAEALGRKDQAATLLACVH